MTDSSEYAKKSTAKGDIRSDLRLRLRSGAAIDVWASHWNDDPEPFVWTKTVDEIITKVKRAGRSVPDEFRRLAEREL